MQSSPELYSFAEGLSKHLSLGHLAVHGLPLGEAASTFGTGTGRQLSHSPSWHWGSSQRWAASQLATTARTMRKVFMQALSLHRLIQARQRHQHVGCDEFRVAFHPATSGVICPGTIAFLHVQQFFSQPFAPIDQGAVL